MQEFLALNSEVTTYFGRKPFVKSRIDKVRKLYLFIQSQSASKFIRDKHPSVFVSIDLFHFFLLFLSIKMMENAFDTLKTAFPNPDLFSPVEDFETDGRTLDSRKYRWEL